MGRRNFLYALSLQYFIYIIVHEILLLQLHALSWYQVASSKLFLNENHLDFIFTFEVFSLLNNRYSPTDRKIIHWLNCRKHTISNKKLFAIFLAITVSVAALNNILAFSVNIAYRIYYSSINATVVVIASKIKIRQELEIQWKKIS